jgi:hypothetical protein
MYPCASPQTRGSSGCPNASGARCGTSDAPTTSTLLRLLDGSADGVTLNASQAAALGDELAFVRTVTADRVLLATIDEVGDLALRAAHSGRDGAFSVEGP